VAEVGLVLEHDAGLFQHAATLDIDPFVRINQDVVYGGVLEQRLQGPQSEYFVQHFPRQALPLACAERRIRFRHEFVDYFLHLHTGLDVFE
jgi:hypothetical protein